MAHPLSFAAACAAISLYWSVKHWGKFARPAILWWGFDGQPLIHGWSIFIVLGVPLLTMLIPYALYHLSARDAALEHMSEASKSAIRHVIWLPAFFLFIIQCFYIVDAEISDHHILHIRGIVFQIGIWLFLWLGHNFDVVEPNNTVGFLTPWTLTSDYVWERTGDDGGWIMFVGGIAVIAISFIPFVSNAWISFLTALVIIASWAGVWYDSYRIAHEVRDDDYIETEP